jgi:alkylhydroperoxidase family enzyme
MNKVFVAAVSLATLFTIGCAVAADDQISRLPRVSETPDDPDTAAAFQMIRARGGQLINLHLTLGHAGKIFYARQMLTYALRFDAVTPRRLRELAIMRTAQITNSAYEFGQHVPIARACGYSQSQIDQLADWQGSSSFDTRERALLAYVDQVVGRNGEVDDEVFDALARAFSAREIVELTVTTTQYVTTSMITRSLRIKPESDGRRAAPDRC